MDFTKETVESFKQLLKTCNDIPGAPFKHVTEMYQPVVKALQEITDFVVEGNLTDYCIYSLPHHSGVDKIDWLGRVETKRMEVLTCLEEIADRVLGRHEKTSLKAISSDLLRITALVKSLHHCFFVEGAKNKKAFLRQYAPIPNPKLNPAASDEFTERFFKQFPFLKR